MLTIVLPCYVYELKNQEFSQESLDQWLRLSYSKGPNRVGVFLPSPEDGNEFSFRNVVFSSYFEFRTVEKVHKPNDVECYTIVRTLYKKALAVLIISSFAVRMATVSHLNNENKKVIRQGPMPISTTNSHNTILSLIIWAGHVARMGEKRNAYSLLVETPERKRPLGRPRRR
jgi:hypothetical protein